ncbi:MAG: DNA polymerase I [Acetobacteraceae bacterium]|nr:DNA polymerase I [Acetobacteraceae bacterium]
MRLVLVDGSGFIFRAFHALPPMTRPDGTPVNAVFGFANMLARLLSNHEGTHIAVIFDAARETFRNRIYPAYKAQRPDPPPELIPQFALVREATEAFGVAALDAPDWEADDLIAAYAQAASERGGEAVIVSSDKDLMQLIGPGVSMMDPIRQKPIGPDEVIEKFGVGPDKVVDVQALAGDSVDNVPGVPGIGVKTAAQLIGEYGDLETLLARASEIRQPKRREALITNAEQARISRELVRLRADAPMPRSIDGLAARAPERGKLEVWLRAQGFRSILARMGFDGNAPAAAEAKEVAPPPPPPAAAFGPYETVTTLADLYRWVEEAERAGIVGFDTETDSLDAMRAQLVGFSLATAPGRACYVPLRHTGDLAGGPPAQLPFDQAIEALRPLLADAAVLKVLHNAKYDMLVLSRPANGACQVAPVDDTMLLSFCLEGGAHGHGMDELSQLHLGHPPISYDSVTGTGKSRIPFAAVPIDAASRYAAEDADVTLRLWQALKPRLREARVLALYEQRERSLIPVLLAMEAEGVLIDRADLSRMSADFATRMAVMEHEAHQLAGERFNLGSPKQLGEILFEKFSLAGGRRTKTGAWGTDADVLESLAEQGHDLPQKILDWRQLAKLKSTYADALVGQINPETGRVHTSFAMAIASTGRLSSTDPNLQNIPVRTEEGARIRHAFIAPPGQRLLSADYSQIELRLLAHVADIGPLREAFTTGQDIHARTASEVFGVPIAGMDKATRNRAKAINFGIIYGISAFGLGRQLGVPAADAKTYIDAYFARYPGIRAYMERTKEEARINGFVLTPFGRRCWIPGITDRNPARRGYAERQAINAPLQGGAADIIKRAMVLLPAALHEAGLAARMLLQVHDELLFEVADAEAEATAAVAKRVMEGVAELSVPLVVETGIGRNWGEAH